MPKWKRLARAQKSPVNAHGVDIWLVSSMHGSFSRASGIPADLYRDEFDIMIEYAEG